MAGAAVLTSEDEAQFTAAFRTADRRKTGTINFKALRDILDTMQQTPLTNEQFYMITADADLENSGQLEFNEYMMCCLAWKNMRAQKSKRMTNDVVAALASNGDIDPAALDAALAEFDMAFSVQSKMTQRKIEVLEGQAGLTADQLTSIMRKTGEQVK